MKKIQLGGHKKGSKISGYSIVDDEDYETLSKHNWYFCTRYVVRNVFMDANKSKKIMMHREVMKTPDGMFTDHINGNSLDNRKQNLRICSLSQNQQNKKKSPINTSGYKGVTWNKKAKKWQAQIGLDYKLIYIGLFSSKIDAAKAYDVKSEELHGKFSLNNNLSL